MLNSIKDKVLQSSDIVEVIAEHVPLTRRGKELLGLCPFHPDHKPSMYVSPTKQIFKCFACGAGGDVIKFVQMRQRVDFREALAILAQRAGIELTVTEADRRADQLRDQVRQALSWARSHFQRNLHETPKGKVAMEYALGRGLSKETVERHGLGLAADAWDDLLQAGRRAGLSAEVLQQAGLITTNDEGRTYDRFRHRLMFPIGDALGRTVAFGGRTLGDDSAKYLNSPETSLFNKSRVLYGFDLARRSIEQRAEACIVEGYTDAILLHQFGFTQVVATLGTALTDAHVKLLKPLADTVTLCFDGDQAGVRAADRAVEVSLLGGMQVRVAVLDAGTDPADCVLQHGVAGFESTLAAARDALEFKWELTLGEFSNAGPRARRVAIESLLAFVSGVAAAGGIDPLEQGFLVRRLSELLALPADVVHQMLAAARKRARRPQPRAEAGVTAVSDYEAALRGLPVGLVAAVEDLFGLLLAAPECSERIDDEVVRATDTCETWKRLYRVIQDLTEAQGEYTQAEVIARCDRADTCELVSRACARTAGTASSAVAETFGSARNRAAAELNILRRGELQRNLQQADTAAVGSDRAFGDLLEAARGQHLVLPAGTHLNTPSAS